MNNNDTIEIIMHQIVICSMSTSLNVMSERFAAVCKTSLM